MTTTLPVGLYPDLLKAYDKDPTDTVLLRAMSDYALEHDNPDLAEMLNWMAEKEVVPVYGEERDRWGFWYDTEHSSMTSMLPYTMWNAIGSAWGGDRDSPTGQLLRVWFGWKNMNDAQKKLCREWDKKTNWS